MTTRDQRQGSGYYHKVYQKMSCLWRSGMMVWIMECTNGNAAGLSADSVLGGQPHLDPHQEIRMLMVVVDKVGVREMGG